MSSSEPLLVQIAYPDIEKLVDVSRVPAVDPRIEMVVTSYVENMELRTAKRLGPDAPGLAEMAPPLDDDYRDALAREPRSCSASTRRLNLPVLAPNLRWIQAVGSGVGQFAASRLDDGDITLTNAAGVGAPSIAEFVVGMIVAAWKDFPALAELQRQRKWESHYGRLIMGSTVGIIGLGAIGAAVAQRIKPFGVEVLAIRRRFEPGMTAPNVDELFGPDSLHECPRAQRHRRARSCRHAGDREPDRGGGARGDEAGVGVRERRARHDGRRARAHRRARVRPSARRRDRCRT